ncbi:protein CURVATURE THYLAKOID 1D, chloroplastic [Arachis duranensis]|uniref:Protein CURVATURE THYLAKOID 1D, chloroplastic n=1 Tax=Arachis duranensis TaxID=130453 RepID=A0A6P4D974_ARADU|nr:protein CURVATURE THYLAKOID 1D, chloroplastic [Arachis duranensis]
MELFKLQAMPFSKLPSSLSSSSRSPLLLTPSLPLLPRSICMRNVLVRSTTSEETSSGSSSFFNEKRDGATYAEVVEPEDDKNNSFNGTDGKEKEFPVEDEQQGLSLDFLDKLDLKFDTDDTGSLVVYGGAAVVALWLTSAIVGAIDSIPLFPKVLEVIGLGYTVWFTSRYLLFKKNRDEFVAKLEELREQVLGSEDK